MLAWTWLYCPLYFFLRERESTLSVVSFISNFLVYLFKYSVCFPKFGFLYISNHISSNNGTTVRLTYVSCCGPRFDSWLGYGCFFRCIYFSYEVLFLFVSFMSNFLVYSFKYSGWFLKFGSICLKKSYMSQQRNYSPLLAVWLHSFCGISKRIGIENVIYVKGLRLGKIYDKNIIKCRFNGKDRNYIISNGTLYIFYVFTYFTFFGYSE